MKTFDLYMKNLYFHLIINVKYIDRICWYLQVQLIQKKTFNNTRKQASFI